MSSVSNLDIIISILICALIVAVFFAIKFYISNSKLLFEKSNFVQELSNLKQIRDDLSLEIEDIRHEKNILEIKNAGLNVNLQNQIQINAQNKELFDKELKQNEQRYNDRISQITSEEKQRNEQTIASFEEKIKLISEKMLNLNSEKLTKSSQDLIKNLLENQIKPLKNELEKYQKSNIELNTIFRENFENLKIQSQNIMSEANKLTNALKNDKKAIGNWGEMQLDLVLNASGLELDKNYEKQVYFTDNDGNRKFIDVLVDFGNGKKAVIDAKCSLINYVEYSNTNSHEDMKNLAKALVGDIKRHIDDLASKNYATFNQDTYDYVFMFIPNENILSVALNSDNSLYQYAYEKNIFLTTPLTLLMAMKTVHLCWQNIKIDENSLKIIETAGKMHDKFALFLENFERIGNYIDSLKNNYETAKNQLVSGRGNFCKQLNELKDLGAKTNKNLTIKYDEYDENKKIPILEA